MQVQGNWKAAANLNLLLGLEHPPARLEKPLLLTRPGLDAGALAAAQEGVARVEARNTANFRTTSYCGVQLYEAPRVRRALLQYYREMLRRIPLWQSGPTSSTAFSAAAQRGNGELAIKRERGESDEEDSEQAPGQQPNEVAHGNPAEAQRAASATSSSLPGTTFRAVGILTQTTDPTAIGEELLVPWEFYAIADLEDETSFLAAFKAMTREVSTSFGSGDTANAAKSNEEGRLSRGPQTTTVGGDAPRIEEDTSRPGDEGQRLSLYTRLTDAFTGVYAGMAIGVIGEPFQRTIKGQLTGVLVRQLLLPSRPMLPWRVDRPLPHPGTPPQATRIHFCSGPFPRRDIAALLRTVTTQALHRGADVLIIGGPLIKPFEDFEKEVLPSLGATFAEVLDSFVDELETTLEGYYATRPKVPHMKIVLVAHRDDVTQVPVLPTTMYALEDTADILVRSNPCRIAINGVHVGVCNEDIVGQMRDRMVERWPTAEGSLRRVVEAIVASRMYAPLFSLPAEQLDMNHMQQLRLDYVPPANELLELQSRSEVASGSPAKESSAASVGGSEVTEVTDKNWSALLDLNELHNAAAGDAVKADAEALKQEPKRIKLEGGAEASAPSSFTSSTSELECMPHLLFLPSTRPQFAVVTHRGVRRGSAVEDESSLDDVNAASGVMVVNQEVWSRRTSPKFELRVAEVTMTNTQLVVHHGASAANGVACGVLHVFNASTN